MSYCIDICYHMLPNMTIYRSANTYLFGFHLCLLYGYYIVLYDMVWYNNGDSLSLYQMMYDLRFIWQRYNHRKCVHLFHVLTTLCASYEWCRWIHVLSVVAMVMMMTLRIPKMMYQCVQHHAQHEAVQNRWTLNLRPLQVHCRPTPCGHNILRISCVVYIGVQTRRRASTSREALTSLAPATRSCNHLLPVAVRHLINMIICMIS